MILARLASEEQQFFDTIIENNVNQYLLELQNSEKSSELAQIFLKHVDSIIDVISATWNAEHDMQGKVVVEAESLSSDTIETFYSNLEPLFELIRSRLPVLRSEHRVAVGTLVNVHAISQLVELSLRSKGVLTYYWGTTLTIDQIKSKYEQNQPTELVLSIMAVNSEINPLEELQRVRSTFPETKIIVGGSAFPMFLVLKEQKDHIALSEPYTKNSSYYEEITKAPNLKEFVSKVFNVTYCESVEEILQELGP